MMSRTMEWRKPEKGVFSVVISGDTCPREENCGDVAARAEEITENVKPYFQGADFRILQWECAVTTQDTPIPKTGPNLRCTPECLKLATTLNTDAVLLANNHTGDYGAGGIADTLAALQTLHISTVGIGMNLKEAEKPLIFEKNGIRMALLNAAEHEFGFATETTAGSNGLDPMGLACSIRELKEQGYLVMVALHGGIELFSFPAPRLQKLCRFLVTSGASAVFCCHSHCPMGYEVYKGVPIVYSPGNFYFPGRPNSLPCWYHGYLPKFYFDAQGACRLEVLPYLNRKKAVELMDEKTTEAFFRMLDELNEALQDSRKLFELYRGWCMQRGIPILCEMKGRCKPDDWNDPAVIRQWLGFRNQMVNESYLDLLQTSLLLIERQQVGCSEEALNTIKAMQNPEWLTGEK